MLLYQQYLQNLGKRRNKKEKEKIKIEGSLGKKSASVELGETLAREQVKRKEQLQEERRILKKWEKLKQIKRKHSLSYAFK